MNHLAELLRHAFTEQLRSLHVALPARIVSYDNTTQLAKVQPVLQRRVAGVAEPMALPVIADVPVIFPRSGGASMTFPVLPDDTCLLLFCERSLDEWKFQGVDVAPRDPRANALADAVAIMGLVDTGRADGGANDAVEISYGSTFIRIRQNDVLIQSPAVTVDGPLTVTGNLTVEGDAAFNGGSVEHNGVNIGETHTHTGVTAGMGTSGPPSP